MSYPMPSAICAEALSELDKPLAIEIARRYNAFSELKTDLKEAQLSLDLAISALKAAGFTLCENGHWKPPLGKPIGSLLESLDAEREAKNILTALILDLTGAALPHMPVDEHLRVAGVKATNAALAVMEGRQP